MKALTVAICTYNRAAGLRAALRALTAQRDPATPFEIVVVDNNSTDETCSIVQSFGEAVRYIFEGRQGLSYARNAAIEAAAGEIVAFTDDDVEVAPGWTATLIHAFASHPEVDCIGGRVLPRWPAAPPPWLTRAHWAPLALQDHGETPLVFDASRPVCLVGANVAFRRSVFARVGLFSPTVQRVRDGVGSTEDHELLLRLYAAGGRALYFPDLLVTAEIPAHRLTRGYHRRWHRGHGRFHAVMRTPEMERTGRGRLLGIPAHLFRTAAADAAAWCKLKMRGEAAEAFARETRLWFFSGFLRERAWSVRR